MISIRSSSPSSSSSASCFADLARESQILNRVYCDIFENYLEICPKIYPSIYTRENIWCAIYHGLEMFQERVGIEFHILCLFTSLEEKKNHAKLNGAVGMLQENQKWHIFDFLGWNIYWNLNYVLTFFLWFFVQKTLIVSLLIWKLSNKRTVICISEWCHLRAGTHTEIFLGLVSANEGRCYTVTPALIGWAHAKSDFCTHCGNSFCWHRSKMHMIMMTSSNGKILRVTSLVQNQIW